MRVAVLHNLRPGGAHRRLGEHLTGLGGDVVEVCLSTAQPLTGDAEVVPLRPRAPALRRALRPPVRYSDFAALLRAWSRAAERVRASGADVVYANPCRYLQAPAALLAPMPPALYFCDEPRRVDHDPSAAGSRRRATGPAYGMLYRAERSHDLRAVARARSLATNSQFSAAEILRAYGRRADVVALGVSDAFRTPAPARSDGDPDYVLSVGSLVTTKGHDLAIAAVAAAQQRRRVVVVAPRIVAEESVRLTRVADAAGVSLELHFGIADAELAQLYAGAFATLYLAAREPYGLVSLEAQAAGSPVIVSDEGGLPETLAAGQRHWAVAREAGAVAMRLNELADGDLRAAASAAGRAHAGARSWADSSARIRDMLEDLCA